MHYMPNASGFPRIGLIVGKRTARHAVQRNYIKRVLRELFRRNRQSLAGVDILLRVQKAYTHADYALIHDEFMRLLEKLAQRTAPRGAGE